MTASVRPPIFGLWVHPHAAGSLRFQPPLKQNESISLRKLFWRGLFENSPSPLTIENVCVSKIPWCSGNGRVNPYIYGTGVTNASPFSCLQKLQPQ